MDTLGKGFSTNIDDNLILKIASNISEIKKIASFNVKIHGEPISDYIISLFTDDPFREESFWLYLEDSRSGEILSSLALLKNHWSFDGINIKIAEMGFVGTLKEHRGKGLYRILNTFYEKIMSQEELFVSVLRGIPYFYSNYGYGFSLPTDTGYCLNVKNFKVQESEGGHSIRRAVKSDFNMIEILYNEIFDSMFISATFNHKSFYYRFNSKNKRDNFGTTYIVQKNHDMIGFFTLAEVHHTGNQGIFLISNMEAVAVIEVINFVIETFKVKEKLCFNISDSMYVFETLTLFDLEPLMGWKWQIKIANLEKFTFSILPILQERLSRSMFTTTNEECSISNYKEIVKLQIERGKIKIIDGKREYPDSNVSIRVPFNYLPMFILGDKSYEEIKEIVPDIMIDPRFLELSKILFPKSHSFPVYQY